MAVAAVTRIGTPRCPGTAGLTPARVHAEWLFLALAAYLAVPLYDVPLLGLSLSAPLMLLIFVEMATGYVRVSFARRERWLLLAGAFWAGCAASLVCDYFWGSQRSISVREGYALVQFGYWMIAFTVALGLCSNAEFRPRVCVVLGFGAIALAGLRIAEGVLFGIWGQGNARVMSQNAYGWQFSAFGPYALASAVASRGSRRVLAIGGAAALFVASAGNGSRGSWISLSAGLALFVLLCSRNPRLFRRCAGGVAAVLCLAGGGIWVGRASLAEPVVQRARTLDHLESDKSYVTRQVMVQKALKLFGENPLFGAGLERFKTTDTQLERPRLLQHLGQEHLNAKSSHNSYLAILAETGLAGSAPLALLLAHLAVGGLRAALRGARRGDIWPGAIYAGFVGMSIHFWVVAGLTGTAPWFVYGLTAAAISSPEARPAAAVRPGGGTRIRLA